MNNKPRVLIIEGSPRKYGSSAQLVQVALRGIKEAGGEAETLFLYDYLIKPCIGCVSEDTKYCRFPCVIEDDDFNKIAEKIIASDGLIIATPVYWYAPSGMLKNFIDRLTCLENMIFHKGRSLLEGKVVGFIATGLDSGVFMAISYLMAVLNSMGAIVAPWSMAYSHLEDVSKDEGALKDAYNVGYLVAETVKAIKQYNSNIGYKPDLNTKELAEIIKEYRVETAIEKKRRLSELSKMILREEYYIGGSSKH
ncbi:MAG: flavodoxin family protein [Desulfurococcaceae archaeon]